MTEQAVAVIAALQPPSPGRTTTTPRISGGGGGGGEEGPWGRLLLHLEQFCPLHPPQPGDPGDSEAPSH